MSMKMRAGRIAGPVVLAALVLTTLPALASPGAAQERERERRIWRGWFPVTQEREMRPTLGILVRRGDEDQVIVADVLEDSPAAEAGMMEGDVILSVGGHELAEPLEAEDEGDLDPGRSLWPGARLRALVSEVPEGEAVTLVVERDGEQIELSVAPGLASDFGGWWPGSGAGGEEWREAIEQWSDPSRRQETLDRIGELSEQLRNRFRTLERDSADWAVPDTWRVYVDSMPSRRLEMRWEGPWGMGRWARGLDLVDLNPGLGAYFGTSEGVLVADADDDSPLGLRPGDVVVAVDGRVVDDIDELRRILRSYEDDEEIAFRIYRDGAQTTVTGTIN